MCDLPAPSVSGASVWKVKKGTIVTMIGVSAEGRVTDVKIVESPDAELNPESIKAIQNYRYKPALDPDGEPAAVRMPFTLITLPNSKYVIAQRDLAVWRSSARPSRWLGCQRSSRSIRGTRMAYRTQIEQSLAEMDSEEGGPKFQGLAVVLAKQKWPRLVACERKWDLGLDAYASGQLEPDGNGLGLACSLTPEYKKIAADATKVKKNYPDVRVLAFATARKVSNHRADPDQRGISKAQEDSSAKLGSLGRRSLFA